MSARAKDLSVGLSFFCKPVSRKEIEQMRWNMPLRNCKRKLICQPSPHLYQKKLHWRLTNPKRVNKLDMITRDVLLSFISEEKDKYSEYSQKCANYQVQPDPLVTARYQGRLDILGKLLQEKTATKS